MNYSYLPRLVFAAGLATFGVCAVAADTRAASPAVHVVSANASMTSPAKILVFIVKDKSAPVSRDVAARGTP